MLRNKLSWKDRHIAVHVQESEVNAATGLNAECLFAAWDTS